MLHIAVRLCEFVFFFFEWLLFFRLSFNSKRCSTCANILWIQGSRPLLIFSIYFSNNFFIFFSNFYNTKIMLKLQAKFVIYPIFIWSIISHYFSTLGIANHNIVNMHRILQSNNVGLRTNVYYTSAGSAGIWSEGSSTECFGGYWLRCRHIKSSVSACELCRIVQETRSGKRSKEQKRTVPTPIEEMFLITYKYIVYKFKQ